MWALARSRLLKRSAYEVVGHASALAMEVVDDMKLGKLVKHAGFRSGIAVAQDAVSVRWHRAWAISFAGVTKNFFAAAQYSSLLVDGQILSLLIFNVLPFAGSLRSWLGAYLLRHCRAHCLWLSRRRGHRDARLAALLLDTCRLARCCSLYPFALDGGYAAPAAESSGAEPFIRSMNLRRGSV